MSAPREPHNPFYLLLLLASLLFVATALGYGVIPVLEQKATEAGQPPPPSEFRDALRRDGGSWLLWELAAMAVLGFASMGLDRLRSLKKQRAEATIPPDQRPEVRGQKSEVGIQKSEGPASTSEPGRPISDL
jgi:hypothetical protein